MGRPPGGGGGHPASVPTTTRRRFGRFRMQAVRMVQGVVSRRVGRHMTQGTAQGAERNIRRGNRDEHGAHGGQWEVSGGRQPRASAEREGAMTFAHNAPFGDHGQQARVAAHGRGKHDAERKQNATGGSFLGPGEALTSAEGVTLFPSTNTRRLFTAPPLSIQASHSACSARVTRSGSPAKRSSGQYPHAADSPCACLRCACMQKRHVRVFTARVAGERCVAAGRKPHFGCVRVARMCAPARGEHREGRGGENGRGGAI